MTVTDDSGTADPLDLQPPATPGAASKGRYSTSPAIKMLVWVQAAGHCEQCGCDLTQDLRTAKRIRWGKVAHVLPASPQGPRAPAGYSAADAKAHTDDPANLMLLCPGCHDRVDVDPEGYPLVDMTRTHQDHLAQVRMAAARGETRRAMGLIVLGGHFHTENLIRRRDLAEAMLSEGLWADKEIDVIRLRTPGKAGRDEIYWRCVEQDIAEQLQGRLDVRTSAWGDALNLAVVAVADIPSLIRVGRQLGDRSNRYLYSRDRQHGLAWPDPSAPSPPFTFDPPAVGPGPLALVVDLSVALPDRPVLEAVPDARIARFSTPKPDYGLIRNRGTIDAFRAALQPRLAELEALTDEPIHLFPVLPAALAVEFGALLSTHYAHRYIVYDRDDAGRFVPMRELGPRTPPATGVFPSNASGSTP